MGVVGDAWREPRPNPDRMGRTVFCLQGGGVTSQQSRGDGWNTNVCYTLNGLDIHAIAYAKRNEADSSE